MTTIRVPKLLVDKIKAYRAVSTDNNSIGSIVEELVTLALSLKAVVVSNGVAKVYDTLQLADDSGKLTDVTVKIVDIEYTDSSVKVVLDNGESLYAGSRLLYWSKVIKW